MGESRTELLAWVNDLLQLNYTKVEQAGSAGAVYCQVIDSVYADVSMHRVKFDAKSEYEYVSNYKVLQSAFDKHKIDKIIPVDKLVKCRFQDNLEFMQWVKQFWDLNFPGGAYNAVARRKGRGGAGGGGGAAAKVPSTQTRSMGSTARTPTSTSRASSTVGSARSTSRAAASGRTSAGVDNRSATMIMELNKQLAELKLTVDGLEKERDFYFGKLRDIEILVQEQVDTAIEEQRDGEPEVVILKEVQAILYSTEDGFEVPPENEMEEQEIYDEDETF
ncbi:hypothetical protein DM01DRAFT_1283487 [Hesseltinella vesiculosa]|uniref:Uncharacterized protein n=1 Tax=Hesseltinella vesiculosa TaxID=101127 RepID=A0A1X2GNI0_9FUNG|nr:hypothetical protein DM01DRAFT_1283487 [Hesseltinella vesiculosa]